MERLPQHYWFKDWSNESDRGWDAKHKEYYYSWFAAKDKTSFGYWYRLQWWLFLNSCCYAWAKVLALDTDEGAIRKLIFNLKNNSHDLKITAGIKLAEIVNLSKKNKSDLVFALALSHHLFFTCKFNFDYIAKCFSSYSKEFLIPSSCPMEWEEQKVRTPTPAPSLQFRGIYMLFIRVFREGGYNWLQNAQREFSHSYPL